MEVDGHNHNDANNGGAQSELWNLTPVAAEQTGKGLPYAPENWPKHGDVWGWRTGRRVSSNGHFQDRYLYLPTRLRHTANQGSSQKQKAGFASKLSVERYVKELYPNVDIDDFFASFSWKIPALNSGMVLFPFFFFFSVVSVFSLISFTCLVVSFVELN